MGHGMGRLGLQETAELRSRPGAQAEGQQHLVLSGQLGGCGWIWGSNSTSWHVLYPDTSEPAQRSESAQLSPASVQRVQPALWPQARIVAHFLPSRFTPPRILASQQEVREVSRDLGPLCALSLLHGSWSRRSGPTAQVGQVPPSSLARGSGQLHGPLPHHPQKEEARRPQGAHAHSPYPHSACGDSEGT